MQKKVSVFIGSYHKYIEDLATVLSYIQWDDIIKFNDRVVLKPNFTFPQYKKGVTTSPRLIEELIKVLKTRTSKIVIGEGEGGYNVFSMDKAFDHHNRKEMIAKYGVKYENFSKSKSIEKEIIYRNKKMKILLPATILDNCDVFISIPVPKIHAMTTVSLGFKNQWGCICDPMRILYHYTFHESILQINDYLNPKIVIGDAEFILDKNGPMHGIPVHKDMLVASNNLGAFDRICCEIMRINYKKIAYLHIAEKTNRLPSLSDIKLNQDLSQYCTHKFTLKRTIKNWGALFAFNSKLLSKLFYSSKMSYSFHRLLWKLYGHPIKEKY